MTNLIKLELQSNIFGNLRALVVAGAKAADTGENGIMAAAQLLQIMAQAQQEAQASKVNGKAADVAAPPIP